MNYIVLVDAALTVLEKLVPMMSDIVSKKEVTAEEQAKLMARIDALRAGGTGFSGPEWKVE